MIFIQLSLIYDIMMKLYEISDVEKCMSKVSNYFIVKDNQMKKKDIF